MPSSGRKTRRWTIGCGLFVAILAAVVGFSWPRERLLLEMAHPVLTVDMGTDGWGYPKEQVYWLTSSRLLTVTTEYDDGTDQSEWNGHVELCDSGTYARTRPFGLAKLLNSRSLSALGRPREFQLSPTGARLYWLVRKSNGGFGNVVATLDGNEFREWETEPGLWTETCFWTDDQHYVQMIWDNDQPVQLKIRDARGSDGDRKIAPTSAEARFILTNYGQNHPLMNLAFIDGTRGLIVSRRWLDGKTGLIVSDEHTVVLPKDTRGCPKLSGKLGGGTVVYYAATAQFSSFDTSFFDSFRPSATESIHKSL